MKVPAMVAAELRRLTSTKMGLIALIALMLVPVLYGGLYLWANQDPYAKLSEVPVALVVDDAGAPSASDPETQINYGEDVAETLIDGAAFDWQRMDAGQAADALQAGDVDFAVTIPTDFSTALTSASGTEPRQALLQLATNDANNYLASSMGAQAVEKIRSTVAEKVGTEAASRLLTGLADVRASLVDATDGASQLADGAASARTGGTELADGTAQLSAGSARLADGSRQLSDGARQVAEGNAQLAAVAHRVSGAARDVEDALPQVRSDIRAALVERGLTGAEIDEVIAALQPLEDRAESAAGQAQTAIADIDRLAAGASTLASSAATLADGAATLAEGAASANSGAAALRDGLSTLADGTVQLRDGLSSGVEQIPASTAEQRTAQANTIADPVRVSTDDGAAADDYGAGLAPFFGALAGWIGIYALFLIVKPVSRRAVTALHSPLRITLAGWLTPSLLGALQMVALMGVLTLALGFRFDNFLGALGILVAASATFTAIILALNVWLGSVGQFLGLVLMVLQLVTAGGTFPWQTLPGPLAALHHVLPMGFVVDAMRQLMYGGDIARAWSDLGILAIWLIGALLLAAIGVTRMTHRRTLRDLQPSLIG
ncbi:YhgE/Pip family protein [Microbacterium aerolatum]|uniref:ABC transporter n=1 Tax=Microbacterium aerolatum TaxID=153731 RepID=A0A511AEN0_9MICO|nr:YhgE/Pip family protein [Microbacterium aerolatum]GEK86476.1 ABC transporter [Microbacterium aerolatum]GGB23187.1 ABC transporter [Microbacterium aerolatum]